VCSGVVLAKPSGTGIVSATAMVLNVLYFAHVRERVGRSEEQVEVPEGATVSEVVDLLVARYPRLAGVRGSVRFAVDGEFVRGEAVLRDGAEFVLIPPVAGGAGEGAPEDGADTPAVDLTTAPLDAARHEALTQYVGGASHGGVVTFVGAVRDHARGQAVTRLEYEAYGSMALRQLARLVAEVEAAIPGTRCAVHHRVGVLDIGDVAVIVAAGSAHRSEAFAACRMLIDRLKEDVPIWKREYGPDGGVWVSERP